MLMALATWTGSPEELKLSPGASKPLCIGYPSPFPSLSFAERMHRGVHESFLIDGLVSCVGYLLTVLASVGGKPEASTFFDLESMLPDSSDSTAENHTSSRTRYIFQ